MWDLHLPRPSSLSAAALQGATDFQNKLSEAYSHPGARDTGPKGITHPSGQHPFSWAVQYNLVAPLRPQTSMTWAAAWIGALSEDSPCLQPNSPTRRGAEPAVGTGSGKSCFGPGLTSSVFSSGK